MSELEDVMEKDSSEAHSEPALIDIKAYPVKDVLPILLQDKSTKRNIIWATDAYSSHGNLCSDKSQIVPEAFTKANPVLLQPRTKKALEAQQARTRSKAEVFTPVWVCNTMNNRLDEEWFGRKNVFNRENEDHTWTVTEGKIEFPDGKTWKDYIDSRRLEITCGEAPFLVSRYDASTGLFIVPPERRIGILDRKLRIVTENASTEDEWKEWGLRSLQSCYGYEWQGDNVLIARINLLTSFCEYYRERWQNELSPDVLKKAANIISWNIWQMDGVKDTVPFGKPYQDHVQMTLDFIGGDTQAKEETTTACRIYNWRKNNSILFGKCKEKTKMTKKMFDFVIGNPPYQQEFTDEGNRTFAAPVYNTFMDAAFKIGKAVELIHPARFLFNAGSTPKAWNNSMLNNSHFSILFYKEDASKIFPGVEIKGGVVISYYDESKDFGPIIVFTKYPELNAILHKITIKDDFSSMEDIVVTRTAYRLTDKMHQDHPEAISQLSNGHPYDMSTNIFDRLPQIFHNEIPNDGNRYIKILGRKNNSRVYKYIRSDYVNEPINLHSYKVFLPSANGNGVFGETLTPPVIGTPEMGSTETFISIGKCKFEKEANNISAYLRTKFCRAMIGVLKTTQHLTPGVMKYVPLQDFTSDSDIDWSKPIPEIDQQLYRKYGLSEDEINFIETHVQEMN